MILVTPHQSIVAVLASSPATQPDFASSVDVYSGSSRIGSRTASGTLSGTTVVQIVENPSGSETRRVLSVTISNRHSAAISCTVKLKDGASSFALVECSIGVGETLQWDGSRWSIFPEPASSIGAADISITGDLSVGDDATIAGDLAVTGTTTTNTWVYNAFTAKGELIASTADNTPGIHAAAASDYHVLQSASSEATGLQWAHRAMVWHTEVADAAAHASSSSESSALYSSAAIPSVLLNEARKTLFVRVWGKASTTSAPNLTLRIKLNDTSASQAIGTIGGATPGSGVTDRMVYAEAAFVVRSTGSSGTVQGYQAQQHGTSLTHGRGQITLNLTNPITVEVTAQWSASSSSNTVTLEGFEVVIMN